MRYMLVGIPEATDSLHSFSTEHEVKQCDYCYSLVLSQYLDVHESAHEEGV